MALVKNDVEYYGLFAESSCCPFLVVVDCGDSCGFGHLFCCYGQAVTVGRVRDVCVLRFDRCAQFSARMAFRDRCEAGRSVGSRGRSFDGPSDSA